MNTVVNTLIFSALAALLIGCGSSSPEASTPVLEGTPTDSQTPPPTDEVAERPAAPDFSLPDLEGNTVELASFRGKIVVLEWFNPGCPFVKYAHGDGPLSDMAAKQTERGVVWLAINSGGPGKQGHGVGANKNATQQWKMQHPVLIDESGDVGKSYGATSTPAMFVVDAEGKIAYKGALDNAPLGKGEGQSKNYVAEALDALLAGKSPATTETQSYGCSVKYSSN